MNLMDKLSGAAAEAKPQTANSAEHKRPDFLPEGLDGYDALAILWALAQRDNHTTMQTLIGITLNEKKNAG